MQSPLVCVCVCVCVWRGRWLVFLTWLRGKKSLRGRHSTPHPGSSALDPLEGWRKGRNEIVSFPCTRVCSQSKQQLFVLSVDLRFPRPEFCFCSPGVFTPVHTGCVTSCLSGLTLGATLVKASGVKPWCDL